MGDCRREYKICPVPQTLDGWMYPEDATSRMDSVAISSALLSDTCVLFVCLARTVEDCPSELPFACNGLRVSFSSSLRDTDLLAVHGG